eukprot:CAMPEP_0198510090 /NCGR_PEP_ID=MMETSP1462-20131121/13971_1 /TAXON_ID=1333877 /ORGANISM="Brandtodinium nutriculum, Strain RCC3387" /LENGTH=63 /DNA_ID=CAMNT_0044239415 /DNA_START=22 /DNA_END=210 /DNA_ORIENTATION=+
MTTARRLLRFTLCTRPVVVTPRRARAALWGASLACDAPSCKDAVSNIGAHAPHRHQPAAAAWR